MIDILVLTLGKDMLSLKDVPVGAKQVWFNPFDLNRMGEDLKGWKLIWRKVHKN